MNPRVWTTAVGLAFSTGQVAPYWVGFAGTGDLPPVPVHVDPDLEPDWSSVDVWQEQGAWLLSGTTFYVSFLDIQPGQTVGVWFAGDLDGPHATYCDWTPPDANGDGVVDSRDISRFLGDWLASAGTHGSDTGAGDFNLNLRVDSADLSAFVESWVEWATR